jgi:ABC-2 type transport system ATP-binding protein
MLPSERRDASETTLPVTLPVEVRDLHKWFRRTQALAGLSFVVQPGEIVGLLGANGAGKTTTIHILLGLILPTSGSVALFGDAQRAHRKTALRRIGFASPEALMDWRLTVHENLRVYAGLYGAPRAHRKTALRRIGFASPEALMDWRLTVHENLRVYAGLYGAPRAAIDELVERFELGPLARQRFGDLSLGQQTRAGLARALMHRPDLLILDEPTASLDPDIADKTRRLLLEIRAERGLSILYSSHNMPEVEDVCDRVIFVHRGRVVAEGTPLAVSRQVLGSEALDTASMEEVFLKISRGGMA